jgi:hypothetical protein
MCSAKSNYVDASLLVTIWNQALQSPLFIRAQRSRGNLPNPATICLS